MKYRDDLEKEKVGQIRLENFWQLKNNRRNRRLFLKQITNPTINGTKVSAL